MTLEHVATSFAAVTGTAVSAVHRLSGGSGAPSWRVDTPVATYAVRLYPQPQPALGQARLLIYLNQEGFPVPEVKHVGSYEGTHLFVLSWLTGITVGEVLQAEPSRAHEFGMLFGQTQARLHALPIVPELRAALSAVSGAAEAEGGVALLHLDYHFQNVMADTQGITGVIDWENVRLGDPRYDVARTLSILCTDPAVRAFPGPLRRVIRRFRQGYLEGYQAEGGSFRPAGPLLTWAGGFMLRDLAQRLTAQETRQVQRWTGRW